MTRFSGQDRPEETLLLNLDDVAHHLRVSRRYVEQMVARSALPHVRFGGCGRVRRCDLEDFVAALPTTRPDEHLHERPDVA